MKGATITFECLWEDIEKQSEKFTGRRVRVSLIPDTLQKKNKRNSKPVDHSTALFLKQFAGAWVGDDLDKCLNAVEISRAETQW